MSYHALREQQDFGGFEEDPEKPKDLYQFCGWLYKVVDGELVKDRRIDRTGCDCKASSESREETQSTAAQQSDGDGE